MSRRWAAFSSNRVRRFEDCVRSAGAEPSPQQQSTGAAPPGAARHCRQADGLAAAPVMAPAVELAMLLPRPAQWGEVSMRFGVVPQALAAPPALAPAPAVSRPAVSVAVAANDPRFAE